MSAKEQITGKQIGYIVIVFMILVIVLVLVFKKPAPAAATVAVSKKADGFKNNIQNIGPANNPLTSDQINSFVQQLADEYQTWIAKLGLLGAVADIGPFDTVVRQMQSQAQFKQVADAYQDKYNIELIDDVQKKMTYNPPLFGASSIDDTSANTFSADMDYINSLPQQ